MFFYTCHKKNRIAQILLAKAVAALVVALIFMPGLIRQTLAQNGEPAVTATITRVDSDTFPSVTAYMAVSDENGPIEGLTEADVRIFEDDTAAPITPTSIESVSLSGLHLVLAVDVSTPPEELDIIKEAIQTLLEPLNPSDKIAIVSFADEATPLHGNFTNNKEELQALVNNLTAGGDFTALHDGIIKASELISNNQDIAGYQAVIVVTDSRDNTDKEAAVEETVAQAEAVNVPFYIIGYGSKVQQEHPLKEQIAETGGQYLTVSGPDDVQSVLQEVEAQLRKGYKVTFSSTAMADDQEHGFTVAVGNGGDEGQFTAVSRAVVVQLPNMSSEPVVRGPIELTPDIVAPASVDMVTYKFDGGQLVIEVADPPYGYTWDSSNSDPGIHNVTVSVVDRAGNKGQTAASINLAEPLAISVPPTLEPIEMGNEFPIEVDAGPNGQLVALDLQVDGHPVGNSCSQSPCTFVINTSGYSAGTHTLTLYAEDNLGQTDEAAITVEFRPPPPEPIWLERLGQQLGFENYVRFKQALNVSFYVLTIFIASLAAVIVVLITILIINRIKRSQRRKSRKKLALEITNLGNIRSHYELWAEDQLRRLKFQFALYGVNLSQRPAPQVSGGYAPPVAPVQVPAAVSSPEPVAYEPVAEAASGGSSPEPAAGGKKESSNVKQSMQKAGSAGAQAQGCMSSLAGILRILGRLLPGPLGQPFRKISQQMTAGQNVARHVTQKPGQVMRQTNQLRRHAAQITPTQSKTSATPSSTPAPATSNVAPAGVDTAGPAVKSPPPQAIPSAPAAAPSGKQQKRRGKGYHTAANPAHTPLLAPGESLTLDLVITPEDPYQAQDYPFTIISNPADQSEQSPVREQGVAQIAGIPWFRRYLPIFTAVFMMLILILGIAFLTFLFLRLDFLIMLETLPDRLGFEA